MSRRTSEPVAGKRLTHREALYELRRTRLLFEDGKISREAWCASVHRILAAAYGYRP